MTAAPSIDAHLPGVGRIALGCMNLGDADAHGAIGVRELAAAHAAVDAALDCGINLFDHADIYRRGRSEATFGALLRDQPSLRERIFVQTKCGLDGAVFGGEGIYRYDLSAQHIVESVHGSLRRLHTERIDVLLLHRPDPLLQRDEVAEACARLHASGKVRCFGVSNMRAPLLRWLQQALQLPLVVNQLEMSLLRHDWLEADACFNDAQARGALDWSDTLHHCMQAAVQLQAWGPLAQGRLCAAPAAGADAAAHAAADAVARVAAELDAPREAVALAWLMRHPAAIQPIVGSRDPARIRAAAAATRIELSREHWYALYTAARFRRLP